jgi:uncharacterized protein
MRMAISKNLIACAVGLSLCLAVPSPSVLRAAAAAEPRQKIRIAFAGDSLADNFWEGVVRLVATNPCLNDNLELGRFARNSTGLTRGDKLYWPREIRRIGETFKPTLFVLTIGVNDRQFIVNSNGGHTAWGSPNWADRYRNEISEFLKGAAAGNAVVLWFGLPAMRAAVDNNDAIEKNKMYAEEIAKLGNSRVQYVEPWRLHSSGTETFSASGPGMNGKLQQIRTADGQHFTTGGEDILAAYTFPKILAALNTVGIRLDQCQNPQASKSR